MDFRFDYPTHWKDWCWSWNSNTLAIWCEEVTHLKRPWSWERLRAGGEGDDRGWDGWMASSTQWTWVWVNSGNWWWTGRPGVLRFTGLQRVRHNWATELNWIQSPQQISFLLPFFFLFFWTGRTLTDTLYLKLEQNNKLLLYSRLENPMNSMKRQKDMTLKDELPSQ